MNMEEIKEECYCENCGKPIEEYEYNFNDGLCDECHDLIYYPIYET